jgi:DNA repair protein RadD
MTNGRASLPVRGMPFKLLLARVSLQAVREIVGESLIGLLNMLDPSLAEEAKLRQLAQETADAASLLAAPKTRMMLINALPAAKARELAILLGVPPDPLPKIFDRLARDLAIREDLAPLFSFFGVTVDERAIRRRRTSGETVEAAYPLFDYQRAAALKVIRTIEREPRRVLLHMPTGAGKTRTAMHIVCDHLRQHGPTVVTWLAGSPELLDQASDEFEHAWKNLGDRPVGLFRAWGSQKADPDSARDGLFVAGFQKLHSLNSRHPNKILALGDRTTLTIVDEAHQAIAPTYEAVIEALSTKHPQGRLVGLSATPGRTWADIDEDARLSEFFSGRKVRLEIPGYDDPVEYLMDEGYLARPTFSTLNSNAGAGLAPADVAALARALDVPENMLEALGEDEQRNLQIIRAVEDLASRHQRIVVFASSVNHARLIRSVLSVRGLEAHYVTGDMEHSAREAAIRRYKGNAPHPIVMCNFGVLTTGFDAPKTSAAVIARPTRSLVLYSQMVGRATRGPKAKGNATAEIVTVVDPLLPGFGDVAEAFENWEDVWHEC